MDIMTPKLRRRLTHISYLCLITFLLILSTAFLMLGLLAVWEVVRHFLFDPEGYEINGKAALLALPLCLCGAIFLKWCAEASRKYRQRLSENRERIR